MDNEAYHNSHNYFSDKTRKKWEVDALEAALMDVKENKKSIREAAQRYDIPKSTLARYVSGASTLGKTSGPATVLTAEEEAELVKWALKMGYGQTRQQICEKVRRIMQSTGRKNPFKDDTPGKDWWYGFLQRHPEVSMRMPHAQALQMCRASACTPEALDRWFTGYEQFLMKYDLLDEPSRIWNCDESGFSMCPKTGKVLAACGARQVCHVASSNKQ